MSSVSKPSSMEGRGFYNRNSAMQAAGIGLLLPLWERVCRTVTIHATNPVIVDYGCSQGVNSMGPVRVAIEELRNRVGTDLPIEVIHTDRPSNDFVSLFEALEDPSVSYMEGLHGIYPSAIGRSYFESIIPPGRVLLGWNTWTMQWMSRSVDAPDHVVPGESLDPTIVRATHTLLASDWEQFLELRAGEMCPGARLLSAFVGRTARETGWEWLMGELWASILDMRDAGLLTQSEQLRLTVPVSARTLEDVAAPFSSGRRHAGLSLDHAEIIQVPDTVWDEFQTLGDPRQLARRHADATRAWAGPTLSDSIDPGRDKPAFLDDLFGRFAARIAAPPRKHAPYLVVTVLAKET